MAPASSLGGVTTRTFLVAGAWAVAGVLGVAGLALGLAARAVLRR